MLFGVSSGGNGSSGSGGSSGSVSGGGVQTATPSERNTTGPCGGSNESGVAFTSHSGCSCPIQRGGGQTSSSCLRQGSLYHRLAGDSDSAGGGVNGVEGVGISPEDRTSCSHRSATSTAAQSLHQRPGVLSADLVDPLRNGASLLAACERALLYGLSAASEDEKRTSCPYDGLGPTDFPPSFGNRSSQGVPTAASSTSSYTAISERVAAPSEASQCASMPNSSHTSGVMGYSVSSTFCSISGGSPPPSGSAGHRGHHDPSPASGPPAAVDSHTPPQSDSFTVRGYSDVHRGDHGSEAAAAAAAAAASSRQPASQHPISFPGVDFLPYPTPEYYTRRRLESAGSAEANVGAGAVASAVDKGEGRGEGPESAEEMEGRTGLAADASGSAAGPACPSLAALGANGRDGGAGHRTGAKVFLGGLRFETIQAGRHVISWIFEAACGVCLPPSSILVHRRSKNRTAADKSLITPTGCASVFVADETDLERLLKMNQRLFCASTGIYVADSQETMKQLLASAKQSLFDIANGKARGPTHPIVVERASRSGGARGGGGGGGGHYSRGSHDRKTNDDGSGDYRSRSLHTSSSSMPDFPSGSGFFLLPQPPLQPQLGVSPSFSPLPPYTAVSGVATPTLAGASTPASSASGLSTPSSMAFSIGSLPPSVPSGAAAATVATALATLNHRPSNATPTGAPPPPPPPPPSTVSTTTMAALLGLLQPPHPAHLTTTLSTSFTSGPPFANGAAGGSQMAPPVLPLPTLLPPPQQAPVPLPVPPIPANHLSFHVFPGDAAVQASFAALGRHDDSGGGHESAAAVVVFLGGLPAETTTEYVAWVLSLLGVRVRPSRIQKLGGGGGMLERNARAPVRGDGNRNSGAASAATTTKVCATASLCTTEELATLLQYRGRVLPTRRGVWVAESLATITALMLEEASLADCTLLHIERRTPSTLPSSIGSPRGAATPPPLPLPLSDGFPHCQLPCDSALGTSTVASTAKANTNAGNTLGVVLPPPPPPYGAISFMGTGAGPYR